ncbi:MAG: hypothetical protein DMC59_08480 [Verrucomicrobia bacterium]|nr:MAG: hypothetical protein DMC59_08480 [Verrucomicrobiota bacterium]
MALFAPNGQIHRRKGQTCSDVYRPGEGDPTHGFETLSALTIRRPPRWFSLIFFGKYGPKFRKKLLTSIASKTHSAKALPPDLHNNRTNEMIGRFGTPRGQFQ